MTKPVKTTNVPLSTPIEIDGKKVTEITLRKPKAGELRGLNMVNILQMDITTMFKLLPRITQPPLSEVQLSAEVESEDFTKLAGQTVVFFTGSSQLQMPD